MSDEDDKITIKARRHIEDFEKLKESDLVSGDELVKDNIGIVSVSVIIKPDFAPDFKFSTTVYDPETESLLTNTKTSLEHIHVKENSIEFSIYFPDISSMYFDFHDSELDKETKDRMMKLSIDNWLDFTDIEMTIMGEDYSYGLQNVGYNIEGDVVTVKFSN